MKTVASFEDKQKTYFKRELLSVLINLGISQIVIQQMSKNADSALPSALTYPILENRRTYD